MATATAPRRSSTSRGTARGSRYRSSPAQKARLRALPKGYRTKAARRRHARRLLAVTSVSVCAIFFATLTFQVMLTQGQFRLKKINKQVAVQKQQFVTLRSQVGQLESPARVLDEAAALGMSQPDKVTYLQPVRSYKTAPETTDSQSTLTEWSKLKKLQAALP